MDFLGPVYQELGMESHHPLLDQYNSLQNLWTHDAMFEMEMASSTRQSRKLANLLNQIVMPVLRARDYKKKPFDIGSGEELVLIENPRVLLLACKVANEWSNLKIHIE